MNRKQWFVLASLFFVLFIRLSWSAHFYNKVQGDMSDLALRINNSDMSYSFQRSSESFMISDNIYRAGSVFALFLTLGFLSCGFLEPKQKH